MTTMFDLLINYPRLGNEGKIFAGYIRGLTPAALEKLMQPRPATGRPQDRSAAARFLADRGLTLPAANIFILSGGHDAITQIIAMTELRGTAIAVDAISYPNFLSIARDHAIQLLPCTSDANGMLPESLEAAAAAGARAVYLMPTVHNPLGTVIPASRRKQLAAIAKKSQLWIIEDDAYAFLEPAPPPPIASWAPERSFYIHSFSKPFAPELKVALVSFPTKFSADVEQSAILNSSGTSLLFASFATHLLESGALAEHTANKRSEAIIRQQMSREILSACRITSHPSSFHLWIEPERISAANLCKAASARKVRLSRAASFAATPASVPNAFRLALGGETDRSRLEQGLQIVSQLLLGT
jgi:DNA-binding transcriptional MocR family regulator